MVLVALLKSLKKSSRSVSLKKAISNTNIFLILHKRDPLKMKLLHHISENDYDRIEFCNWTLYKIQQQATVFNQHIVLWQGIFFWRMRKLTVRTCAIGATTIQIGLLTVEWKVWCDIWDRHIIRTFYWRQTKCFWLLEHVTVTQC